MDVLVFKTSVKNELQASQLQPKLDKLIQQGECWNFDLEDCDRILRFEANQIRAEKILKTLHQSGFECEELL
ncbi:hypothetical protein APR41_07170 [Salegentibacter salinarum]|uniref:HMA domain-containing protein n=1 Tax=Salegentibacter salinarum TaxID=447422 RepID=A0A2N0TR35_9FLAO|nr:hypothetical protein APR41_07170 [Salegentibacter salinarum]SKB56381.1 hypothetical protein SAMN05660903_01460 [Salegentibacter salinarum]